MMIELTLSHCFALRAMTDQSWRGREGKNSSVDSTVAAGEDRVGFQNSVVCADQQVSRCPFVLVGQAAKNRSTLDPFIPEVGHGVGRSWRGTFAGAVRSSTVVALDVLREHHTQGAAD
jgi:hypothetical protein